MRNLFLAVAVVTGLFAIAWVFGWGHVGDIHQQDYGLALARGDEIIPPIPSPLRPIYERVPGRYAGLAVIVSLAALLLAEAVGPRPLPMGIRVRNTLWARIRRWMRTHRRATYVIRTHRQATYGAQFRPEAVRDILVGTTGEDRPQSTNCQVLSLFPPPEYILRPME